MKTLPIVRDKIASLVPKKIELLVDKTMELRKKGFSIAPTARGYATNLSIVSAHLAGNRVNLEWIPLLKFANHTVVVLMGVSRAKEIKKCTTNIGMDMDKDVAIISNASRKDQSVRIGKLVELEELCKDALRPALIVFGDVVNLHSVLPKYGEE